MKLPPPITSRTNARVKSLRASLSGKPSQPGDLLGVEGSHLITELHKSGQSFDTMFIREGSESILQTGWPKDIRAANWAVLSRDVFDSAMTTASPQGIAATWIIREPAADTKHPTNVLILEDLQDPGNLGTLIRSAVSFGFGCVMVTPGTASQWNPKVVRSSAGSVFRMPVQRAPIKKITSNLHNDGVRIFAAVASFETPFTIAAPHGVLTGRRADTPGSGGYIDHGLPSSPDGYAASFAEDTDFVQPCAILIGNEGAGLSREARALADEQVMIPCNWESLNAAVAGSVLMYEVSRQIKLRFWAKKQGLRP
jgi:RNA methyltransferase, TrmH family